MISFKRCQIFYKPFEIPFYDEHLIASFLSPDSQSETIKESENFSLKKKLSGQILRTPEKMEKMQCLLNDNLQVQKYNSKVKLPVT